MENTNNKEYVFANWGEKVFIKDYVDRFVNGVITEFDNSDECNTKVVYKNGGFDWYSRDYIEESMKSREQVLIDLENEEDGYSSIEEKKADDVAEYGEKARF